MATNMARKMVTEWGLSDKIGMIDYGRGSENFLGQHYGGTTHISEEMENLIDSEVKRLVHAGYEAAMKHLKNHAKELEMLAQGLLEYETLSGDEIRELLKTGKVDRSLDIEADKGAAKAPRSSVPSTVKKNDDDDQSDMRDKSVVVPADEKVKPKPQPKKKSPSATKKSKKDDEK
jgi:cell division protease FtsH